MTATPFEDDNDEIETRDRQTSEPNQNLSASARSRFLYDLGDPLEDHDDETLLSGEDEPPSQPSPDDIPDPYVRFCSVGTYIHLKSVSSFQAIPIAEVNMYQDNKIVAQGCMDMALMPNNTNQLRNVIESTTRHPYYSLILTLIIIIVVIIWLNI